MPSHDPVTNTYILRPHEVELVLEEGDGDAIVIGNTLGNILTGNSGANSLVGGEGDDILSGGGGADTLIGGIGADTYYVDGDDEIVEPEGDDEARDKVGSTVDYTLGGGSNIEDLFLLGDAIHGVGNEFGNQIGGNAQDNLLEGLDGDDTLSGGGGQDTLRGGRGDDTYLIRDPQAVIEELEGEGTDTVMSENDFDLSTLEFVENLVLFGDLDVDGTGNALDNNITGNAGANILSGGGGHDTLDGGEGADALIGGEGDDTYIIDHAGDVITEAAGAGNDTVVAMVGMNISLAGTELENVVLTVAGTATGNDRGNRLTGSDGNDGLDGGKGDDRLDGGRGVDGLYGGEGDDTYIVDHEFDVVQEHAGEGYDRVIASASYRLAANLEYLALTGETAISGTGNGLGNRLIGNDGSNILRGEGGDDALSGGGGNDQLIGGAGSDNLAGGAGNDTYVIDAADILSEGQDEGRDTVIASFSYTLHTHFESLTLTGAGNLNGTGNLHDNDIRGNAGANILKGLGGNDSLDGGAGADRLEGGAGNDLYVVDTAKDAVIDTGGGYDRVLSSISYKLGGSIEYLALQGAANLRGTGNSLNNTIYGNKGANRIDGGGGRDRIDAGEGNDYVLGGAGDDYISDWRGNDTLDGGGGRDELRGGVGNDIYYVDALDNVLELSGEGRDTVVASQSFALRAASAVEILKAKAGTSAIRLTGSATANKITGNAGANTINGAGGDDTIKGGSGKDVLKGGAGRDIFAFDTKPNAKTNVDRITDYSVADDAIWLDNAIFKKIGKGTVANPGALNKSFFKVGSKARDANDYFVYDKNKGILYFDEDGSGAKAAVQIAFLSGKPLLTHKEFFII